MIAKLSIEDLRDRYFKLYDEFLELKQHARKQEDKITKSNERSKSSIKSNVSSLD